MKASCSSIPWFQIIELGHFSSLSSLCLLSLRRRIFFFFSHWTQEKRERGQCMDFMSQGWLQLYFYLWSTEGKGMDTLSWVFTVSSHCSLLHEADFRVSLPFRRTQPVSPWHEQKSLHGGAGMGSVWGPEQARCHSQVLGHTVAVAYTNLGLGPPSSRWFSDPWDELMELWDSVQSSHPVLLHVTFY